MKDTRRSIGLIFTAIFMLCFFCSPGATEEASGIRLRVKDKKGNIAAVENAYLEYYYSRRLNWWASDRVKSSSMSFDATKGSSVLTIQLSEIARIERADNKWLIEFRNTQSSIFDVLKIGYDEDFFVSGTQIIAGRAANYTERLSNTDQIWVDAVPTSSKLVPALDVQTLTEDLRKQLSINIGTQGVLLNKDFRGLPAGIVIDSIYHRFMGTREQFLAEWDKHKADANILIGYWQKGKNDKWERQMKFVVLSENYRPEPTAERFLKVCDNLQAPDLRAIIRMSYVHDKFQKEVGALTNNANPNSESATKDALIKAKASYDDKVGTPEIVKVRTAVLQSLSDNAPLLQKILLRSLDKTTKDREALIVDLLAHLFHRTKGCDGFSI
ncbi:MAG: hypothetical protein FJ395_18470 [Verrucomicrobia bacterium]|nr:hypothetical protein [Verrucomicrobiota bacterium]